MSLQLNRITNKGVEYLSLHLDGNSTLKKLNLNKNHLIDNKAVTLLMHVVQRSTVSQLSVFKTGISANESICLELECKLKASSLENIFYSNRGVTDEGLMKIFEIMKNYNCDKLKIIE